MKSWKQWARRVFNGSSDSTLIDIFKDFLKQQLKDFHLMEKKKLIGVIATRQQDGIFGLNTAYVQWANKFGNTVIIDPISSHVHKELDLLILPGGADVSPTRYLTKPSFQTSKCNLFYEHFDINMLPQYIAAGIPVFGICRGFQTLNVHFGGKLNQHIAQAYSTVGKDGWRGKLVDKIYFIKKNFPLVNETIAKEFWFTGKSAGKKPTELFYEINSIHHQGISGKISYTDNKRTISFPYLAKDLNAVAFNSKQNNLEAFVHDTLPIAGVQWHPEEIGDVYSENLVRQFLTQKVAVNENIGANVRD